MPRILVSQLLGVIGAIIGGVLGFYAFGWLVSQGLYGLMIPGAMLGLGCSLLAQHRSLARGIACGLAALGLGLYSEWRYFPFLADVRFKYLILHAYQLKLATQLMIGFGAFLSAWIGKDASPIFTVFKITPRELPPSSN